MAKVTINQLYDNLKEDGWVEKDFDNFNQFFFAAGEQGYKNRKALYDNMREDGYVDSPTYEDFMDKIDYKVGKSSSTSVATPTAQPVEESSSAPAEVTEQSSVQQQKPWQPSLQDKLRASWDIAQGVNNFKQGNKAAREKVKRQAEMITPEGRQKAKVAKASAKLVGADVETPLLGGSSGAAASSDVEQPKAVPTQSPQVAGVKFDENGQPVTEWMLPDGTLTTDRQQVGAAEERARATRLQHEFEGRMKENGLDPTKEEDVKKQADYETVGRELEEAYREKEELETAIKARAEELDREYDNAGLGTRILRGLSEAALSGKDAHAIRDDREARNYTADKRYNQLAAALRHNRQAINILEDKRRNKMNEFWLGLGKEMVNGYTFDYGVGQLNDSRALNDAAGMVDTINEKRRKGEALNEEEQTAELLLTSLARRNDTEGQFSGDYGAWARAGKMASHSIELLPDFAMGGMSLMQSITTKSLAKMGLKEVAKGFGNKVMRATGIGMGALAGGIAMTNTIQAPRLLSETAKNYDGQLYKDADGNFIIDGKEGFMTSFLKAQRELIAENASEAVGAYLPSGAFVGGLVSKGLEKMGLSKLNTALAGIGGKQWYRNTNAALEQMGFNGTVNEGLEEYAGIGYQALMADRDALGSLTDMNTHVDIWLGTVTMGALLNTPQYIGTAAYGAQYAKAKHGLNKNDKTGASVYGERWEGIKSQIDGMQNESVAGVLTTMLTDGTASTKAERQALLDYAGSLQRMRGLNIGQMMGGSSQDAEVAQTYSSGYEASTPREMVDAQNMYEYQRQRLVNELGSIGEDNIETILNDIENDPVGALNKTYDPALRDIVMDYANAKTVRDGMIQRVNDDIDEQIAQSNAMIDGRINKESGLIVPATMGLDDRQVYVVSGNLVANEDGSIDRDASDESVIVRNAQTGELEFTDPRSLSSLGEAIDPEEERATATEAIRQQYAQSAVNAMNGTLAFNPGDVVLINDGNNAFQATIVGPAIDEKSGMPVEGQVVVQLPDGQQTVFTKEQLQAFADAANLERINTFEQERAAARAQQRAAEAEAKRPQFALNDEFTILDEDGNPIRGSITGELDDDGTIEIYTEEPVNGKLMNRLTPEELEGILDSYNGAPLINTGIAETPMQGQSHEMQNEAPSEAPAASAAAPNQAEEMQLTALSRIPVDEEGEPLFEQTDPATAWNGMTEYFGDADDAIEFARSKVKTLKNEKDKLVKAVSDIKATGSAKEFKEAKAKARAQLAAKQAQLDHWNSVVNAKIAKEQAEAEARRQAEEAEREERQRQYEAQMRRQREAEIAAEEARRQEMEQKAAIEAKMQAEAERQAQLPENQERERAVNSFEEYIAHMRQEIMAAGAGEQRQRLSERIRTAAGAKQYGDIYAALSDDNQASTTSLEEWVTRQLSVNKQRVKWNGEGNLRGQMFTAGKKEKVSEVKQLQWMISDRDGIPFWDFVHKMWETLGADSSAGFNREGITDQDVRNMVIEVLRSHPTSRSLFDSAIEMYDTRMAGDTMQGGLQQMEHDMDDIRDEWYSKNLGMSFDEYNARVEAIYSEIRRSELTDEDIDAINSEIADEQQNINDNGNDNEGALRSGAESVQAEQSDGRAGDASPDVDRPETTGRGSDSESGSMAAEGIEQHPTIGGRKADVSSYGKLAEEIESSKGPFGAIYTQFRGKPKEAVAFLLAKRDGEAIGALHHNDVGDIDLVWGSEGTAHSDGFGLAKLAKYHPEVLLSLQEILNDMAVTKRSSNRVQLESEKYKAAIRLTWDKQKKTWLLTMFEKKNSALDNTTGTGKTLKGNGNDTATPESTVNSSDEFNSQERKRVSASSSDIETEPEGKRNGTATPQNELSSIGKDNALLSDKQGGSEKSLPADKSAAQNEVSVTERIAAAEAEVNTEPSEAQKEAGNYKMGHVKIDGLDISIENPKGSTRSGKDANGNVWETKMNNTYGYIRGTTGVDGDKIDVFLSDNPADGNVYVVDQYNTDGSFDEHKVMYGFTSADEAKAAYLSNYSADWAKGRRIDITGVTREEFKKWLDASDRKTKPFADYAIVKKKASASSQGSVAEYKSVKPINPSGNKLVTDEQYAKLRERMRKKFGQLNMGIDPELINIGIQMSVYHIEKGARKFTAYASAMIADIGDTIRPYLKAFYNAVREMPEVEKAGIVANMDSYEDVRKVDIANFDKTSIDAMATAAAVVEEQKIADAAEEAGRLNSRIDEYAQRFADFLSIAEEDVTEENEEAILRERAALTQEIIDYYLRQGVSIDAAEKQAEELVDNIQAQTSEAVARKLQTEENVQNKLAQENADEAEADRAADLERERAAIVPDEQKEINEATDERNERDADLSRAVEPTQEMTEAEREAATLNDTKADATASEARSEVKGNQPSTADNIIAEVAVKEAAEVKGKTNQQHIEDFGEKILGARKDMLTSLSEDLESVSERALVELSLSKALKRPDFKKAVEAGAMTQDEAQVAEALWQTVYGFKKPAATKRHAAAILVWAKETHMKVKRLQEYLKADSEEKQTIIKKLQTISPADEKAERADFERIQSYNSGRTFAEPVFTPDPAAVALEVMKRMGLAPDEKVSIPFRIAVSRTKQYYEVAASNGDRIALSTTRDINEALELMAIVARMHRGDLDIVYPESCFRLQGNKAISRPSGIFEVGWMAGRFGLDYKHKEFPSIEEADSYAATLKEKGIATNVFEKNENTGKYESYRIRFINPINREATLLSNTFQTKEDALTAIAENIENLSQEVNEIKSKAQGTKSKTKEHFFVTTVYRHRKRSYAVCRNNVGQKDYVQDPIVKEFDTRAEAEAWFKANKEALEKEYADYLEKRRSFVYFDQSSNPRIGKDYRDRRDVTPEQFSEAFGFRGVQFGNWTNGKDRQAALNEAYDAFMDLAHVTGLSPRALSLNGELGLSFGARGSGSANAHYEPGEVVINLTKTRGAGSLAHEWWHAMDNYFMRKEGIAAGFATAITSEDMRPELAGAFKALTKAISGSEFGRRSDLKGEYWGRMIEKTARLFGEWVVMKLQREGNSNHFLSRGIEPSKIDMYRTLAYFYHKAQCKLKVQEPMSKEEFMKTPEALMDFPYPTPEELEALADKVQGIFNMMRQETTVSGIILSESRTAYERRRTKRALPTLSTKSLFDFDFEEEVETDAEADKVNGMVDDFGRSMADFLALPEELVTDEAEEAIYNEKSLLRQALEAYYTEHGSTTEEASKRANELITKVQAQVSVTMTRKSEAERFASSEERGAEEIYQTAGGESIRFDGSTGLLPKLREGEYALVERRFAVNGGFDFSGRTTVESADDVAFIFRTLESYGTEQAFGVLLKDGKPTIIHLGSGSAVSTVVDLSSLRVANDMLGGADAIWLVHNHPSGILKASPQDASLQRRLALMFPGKVQDAIIMDTKRGLYATFDTSAATTERQRKGSEGSINKLPTYSFSDQVFAEGFDFDMLTKVGSSQDVAAIVAAHRLGDGDKTGVLLLNNANKVIGNILCSQSIGDEALPRQIADYALSGGATHVIIYGRDSQQSAALRVLKQRISELSGNGVSLLDSINIKNRGSYESAADNGVFEPETEYGEESSEAEDGFVYRTSSEIDAEYPNWLEGTTTENGKHSTQVEGTRKTYGKVGDWIENNLGKDVEILDASSGMGYGTTDLRERGFNIEDVEPYQSEQRKANNPATYDSYGKISKQYDFIISNAVLNVVPDDWRSDVLHDMASRLKARGKLFINTRKAGEEKSIKDKIELDSPQEVLVKRNGKIASYQKFFTPKELKEWVASELGEEYDVEIANEKNSGTKGLAAVVVTRNENINRMGEGYGAYSDAEVSYLNDTASKLAGKNRFSKKRQTEFAARERRRMADRIQELAEHLHLNNVEVLTDTSQLEGKRAKAKGFFNKRTGKITIVLPNNYGKIDAEQTLLHEAVAHYGLRKLFGEHFNMFLDNVYESAEPEIRRKVAAMAAKYGWDFRTATEEYLAGLAEDTNFDEARAYGGWWSRIKRLFLDMLEKIGFEGFRDSTGIVITDNELRYLLWRSYENLRGRDKGIFRDAADVVKQVELKVGNYAEGGIEADYAAEPLSEVNESFNKQLGRWISGQMRPDEVIILGNPKGVMRHFLPDTPILLRQKVLSKSRKKHGLSGAEMENLPGGLARPVFVFKSNAETISVLTELKSGRGENLFVAIELEKDLKLGGNTMVVNDILTIHGREAENIVLPIIHNGTLAWVDKEKGLEWLHSAKSKSQAITIQDLDDAAKIVKSFENPTVEGGELFRPGDFTPRDKVLARDEYERMVNSGSYQFKEAVQDSMLGLKKLYQAIYEAEASTHNQDFRIENIPGFENAYLYENRMSSMNAGEQHEYFQHYMQPLLKEIAKIAGADKRKRKELTDYLMAKHGLERNEYMRNEAATNGEDTDRDFAGLIGLTGEADWRTAEATAQQWVDDYESMTDTTALWDAINKATKATLEKIYLSGIISKETYEKILGMYQYYIPLRGWNETTSEEVYGYLTSKDGPLGGSIMKKAEGRSSMADDPIATIGMMADDAIRQGNRNLMKQRFLNFILNHPSDAVSVHDIWLEYDDVADEWHPVFADVEPTDTADEVAKKVEAFEQRMEVLQKADPDKYKRGREAQHIPYKVVNNNLREHQVLIKRNGRTFVATINGNPRAAQAINGLTNPDVDQNGVVGNMLKLGTWVNRQLSAFYTTRNPDFVVGNFFRDMLYSNCMTWVKESPRYALRFHKNFGKFAPISPRRTMRLRKGIKGGTVYSIGMLLRKWEHGTLNMADKYERLFYQFMKNGGETGYTNVRDIEGHKRAVAAELKKQGNIGRKAWSVLGMQLDLLNRSAENCARFAAFVTSREFGRSIDRAIYDAKEISVNFNKKGSGGKMVNAVGQTKLGKFGSYLGGGGRLLYVFWNAGIQGFTNFGRQAKLHPAKFATGAAALFTLGYVIPMLAQMVGGGDGDDDDKNAYYNLPEYVRRSNICFRAGGQWITIPLPIEYRAMYGMGELAHGVISGNERYSNSELAYQMASQVSQILPLDMLEGGGGISPFIPSAAKPFTEAYIMNKSWTGLPVYKDTPFNKNEPEWTKAYASTDKHLVSFAKWLNETTGGDDFTKGAIDINPAKIEYLLNGTFGGLFTFPNKVKKTVETKFGDRDFEWRNIPIANRLIKSGDERTAFRKLQNEYFKYKEESEETARRLRKYQKADEEGLMGYAEKVNFLENSPEYLRYEIFGDFKDDIAATKEAREAEPNETKAKSLEAEYYGTMRELVDALHEPSSYFKKLYDAGQLNDEYINFLEKHHGIKFKK